MSCQSSCGSVLAGLGLVVWVAVPIFSAPASHAQVSSPSTPPPGLYEGCQAEAGGISTKLEACDEAELRRRGAALDQLYQQLLRAMDPGRREGLRRAERAWVAYADAECDFRMSAGAGGTNAPLVHNACRLELLARRIGDLRQALGVAQF